MQTVFFRRIVAALFLVFLLTFSSTGYSENIDPVGKFAWSETAGWLNFETTHSGVHVYNDHLEGFAWSENVGWIKMGVYTDGGVHTCANTSDSDWGVNNNGAGDLSGYAWSEVAGWINFTGVTIDPATGAFGGYAWGENIGYIHLAATSPVAYGVKASLTDPASIPILSDWGMVIASFLLGLAAVLHIRRRQLSHDRGTA
jgi:hypothetical protein